MSLKKNLIRLTIAALFVGGSYGIYRAWFKQPEQVLYSVKRPVHRNVLNVIKATGSLKPEDVLKVGSLVSGILAKTYVDENDVVKKDQVIALVDDGKEDTEVREALAYLEQSKIDLTYVTAYYARNKALHDERYISDDEFERIETLFHNAEKEVIRRQAQYDRILYIYNKKQIRSPGNGVIISKVASEGEAVTNFGLGTVIYTIAKDISKMEAKVEIDETTVGSVKRGMKARLTYDTYLGQVFEGTIKDISNNALEKGGTVSYLATIPIDNKKLLFRPGMTVNAEIVTAQRMNVLTIEGQQLAINRETLRKVAQIKGFDYKPLSNNRRTACQRDGFCKSVWVKEGNAFVERPIKVGLSDGAFFEVVQGLTEKDEVVDDTIEENMMDKFFKKFFNTGLK